MDKESLSRKEKKKALKKSKRQQARRERAAKERLEAEARLNDPAEQARLVLAEQEDAERCRRELAEFEARERSCLAAIEENQRRKTLEEEEDRRRKARGEDDDEASRFSQQVENENDGDDCDGDWEYIEEGPPEIIWQGNEIILKKKKIRVSKKKAPDESNQNMDAERPTSNPFPPESEAFGESRNSSVTGQDLIGSVALQVPNFGTEQDKAHCPFHLKTGVCRFGQRCSRIHFYPDKSCILLIKNMYNGPGLAWEQDEGLEYTDEEVERSYEEFYEDVHTEFLKFGEIVNFKVCRNGSFHLRGNVYVHFKSLDSAVLAYHSVNGRYFAGKQVSCEFVNVTRWKVAICGEYMKTRFKTCTHGTACNFIHCFRNPGGDYEWADSDKPPPRYWVKKMIALFGYSDDTVDERQTVQGNLDQPNCSGRLSSAAAERYHSRRSRSREKDYSHQSSSTRKNDNKDYVRRKRDQRRCRSDGKDKSYTLHEDVHEDSSELKDILRRKRKTHRGSTGESFDDDRERSLDGYHDRARKSSRWNSGNDNNDFHSLGSNGDLSARKGEKERGHCYTRKRSKYQRAEKLTDYEDCEREDCKVDRDRRGEGRDEVEHSPRRRSKVRNHSEHRDRKRGSHDTDRERSEKDTDGDRHSSRRKRSVSYGKSHKSSDNRGKDGVRHIREYSKKVSESSDSEGEVTKRVSMREDRSHSRDNNLRSDRSDDSNCSSECDDQYRLYDVESRCSEDVEIVKLDRWEPEKDGTETRSRGRNKRDKSCDTHSELDHD